MTARVRAHSAEHDASLGSAGLAVRRLVFTAAFLRSIATAMSGVLLGFYLAALGLSPKQTGAIIGIGLAGVAAAALIATTAGEPEERTFASGVTNVVRLGGWAAAPLLAGTLMHGSTLAAPLVVGAALKIVYDAILYAWFRHLPPPEEQPTREGASARHE